MSRKGYGVLAGRPLDVPLSLRVACPVCDAPVAKRCQTWSVYRGQRLYVNGPRNKNHSERVQAARDAEKGAA